MVPLGVQVFIFETESASPPAPSPQTLVGKAEKAKRRKTSLPAFLVNWGVEPDAFFEETRLEPTPQNSLIHGNMLYQPGMADPVEARFDVTFQDPSWTVRI